MACKLRQYLLSKSNLIKTYQKHSSRKIATSFHGKPKQADGSTQPGSTRNICQWTKKSTRNDPNSLKKFKFMPVLSKFRYFRSSSSKFTPCENEDVNSLTYTTLADHTLEYLSDSMDEIISSHADHIETDVSLHSGVLTINLSHLGTYVINKQSPNRQIWLSSPISGPWRFDLVKQQSWISTKDHQHLDQLLSRELSDLFNQKITLHIELKNR